MWESISEEDFGRYEQRAGIPVTRSGGIWWLKVRPFFYRPLLSHRPLDASDVRSPGPAYQYAVNSGQPTNSYLNLVLFDDTCPYDPGRLLHTSRRKLRQAEELGLRTEVFPDIASFLEPAYAVYRSFYERTHYRYPQSRLSRARFEVWAKGQFAARGVCVLGCFKREHLLSVEVSCLVGDVLMQLETINSDEALQNHAPDFMLDFERRMAREHSAVRAICGGYFGKVEGINHFKLQRGARVVALPAHLHVHPLALACLKSVRFSAYERLVGFDEDRLQGRLRSIT